MERYVEIIITDVLEDPADGSAFGVNFEVQGPGNRVAYVRVSFTDRFIQEYFRVPWMKDLAREEARIERDKRDLFIRWALAKVEEWLEAGAEGSKIVVDFERDEAWAKAFEEGKKGPSSVAKNEQRFIYFLKRGL
jgi:hypothetical protein